MPGIWIFLSPLSSSLSELEITSEDNIRIERNDFNITVKKIVIPLSVTDMLKILKCNLNNASPLFRNGINIETKNGNKNSKKVLLIRSKKFGLKRIIIKTLRMKYNKNI